MKILGTNKRKDPILAAAGQRAAIAERQFQMYRAVNVEAPIRGGVCFRKMPRKPAPTKSTGGGGYTFEDKVAAWFVAQMLARSLPLGERCGAVAEIHFQTRESGWLLDDLLLILAGGDVRCRCALSVKSNTQFTRNGFPEDFVQDIWEQWRGVAGSDFNPLQDRLGLVLPRVSDIVWVAFEELQNQAAETTPERIVKRLEPGSRLASALQRKIFDSIRSPKNQLPSEPPSQAEAAKLLARLNVFAVNFVAQASNDLSEAINLCSTLTESRTLLEGKRLWKLLIELAAANRAPGGHLNLPKVIAELRGKIGLRDYPDYETDWTMLHRISSENASSVRRTVGATIHIDRTPLKNEIAAALAQQKKVVVAGESGSGKTGVVAELLTDLGNQNRIIWLNPSQLDQSGQLQLARELTLQHPLQILIQASPIVEGTLVIDGLEQLGGNSKSRAFELIKLADSNGWRVLLTCQPQSWSEALKDLTGLGLAFKWFNFRRPSAAEIIPSIQAVPGLVALFFRRELQPMLCNLAILDQVIKAQLTGQFSPSSQRIGESDLIDWIWDFWIGSSPMKHARAELLRRISETDAEKISGGTALNSIPATSLELLGELEADGLLRVTDTTVWFSHDLLSDWGRLRTLIVADQDAMTKAKEDSRIPRWNRAIQLYAQRLAERGSGLTEWKSKLQQIKDGSADAANVADLFLDGIIFAANAELLLEEVWTDIVTDNGEILRRLLQRVLHTATVPDWRLQAFVDPKDASDAAVWFRIPNPLYWIPLLRVLNRHETDVATTSLVPAAAICELWLRTMPSQVPGRVEAAHLTVQLAKEAQDRAAEGHHHFSGDACRKIFAALLYAAPEFPDETLEIALELCGRRDEPDHAISHAIAEQERREEQRKQYLQKHPEPANRARGFSGIPRSRGPMRAAAADGPARRVEEAFQSAVLDTSALNSLVTVRPAGACEVLLASCIEEPKEVELNPSPISINFGLNDWNLGRPEAYFKGPFLSFLQNSPGEGLEAIVRLVNHATDRWLERAAGPSPTKEDMHKYGLEFPDAKQPLFLLGNCNVFGWNRSNEIGLEIVACALMALEKWLYDELEKENSVDQWIETILKEGRSLALAGVLVTVGLKYQALFTGTLRQFLGNILLYECQAGWARSEVQQLWKIQFQHNTGPDPRVRKLLDDWHAMSHRKLLLRDVAQWLFIHHKPTREYLDARRQVWAKRLENASAPDREDLEFFLARFDPANYQETPVEDGRIQIEYRWPEELDEKAQESRNIHELQQIAMEIPPIARRCLSGNNRIKGDQLENFWEKLQLLVNNASALEDRFTMYADEAIAGGIAVLVTQNASWLNNDPAKKKWCLDTLRQMSLRPRVEESSPHDLSDTNAESFLGEAAVALLTEVDHEFLKILVFNAITGFYYNSTSHAIVAVYRLRAKLGRHFEVLLNVMTQWSVLRRAAIAEHMYNAKGEVLEKYRVALRNRYLKGAVSNAFVPLSRIERLGRALLSRVERREQARWHYPIRKTSDREDEIHHDWPPLDTEVLKAGFTFLGEMSDSPSQAEVDEFIQYVRVLFDMELRIMPRLPPESSGNKELKGTPHDYERWIWQLASLAIVRTEYNDLRRNFWQPVLDWGATAHYWVRDFFNAWFNVGLPCCGDLKLFARIWKEMVEYTFESAAWNPEGKRFWFHLDDLSVDLMGLRDSWPVPATEPRKERFLPLIQDMQDTFSRWFDKWSKRGSAAMWFAHFLPSESGRALLVMGIKKLAAVVPHFSDRDWDRENLSISLYEALRACWSHKRAELESDGELRRSFWSILSALCGRMDAHALQLRAEIAGRLATA